MHLVAKTLFLAAVFAPGVSLADTTQTIHLVDGSQLRAEVISLSDGTYTLRSNTLGEMKMSASKITLITAQGTASAASVATAPSESAVIDNIRKSITQNPDAMSKIDALQNDPMIKDILNDKKTMRAISQGDLSALMNNPKIKALMENSTVRELTQDASF